MATPFHPTLHARHLLTLIIDERCDCMCVCVRMMPPVYTMQTACECSRPLARALQRTLPASQLIVVSESSRSYKVLAVTALLIFPPCAVLGALALAGTQHILILGVNHGVDAAVWLSVQCKDILEPAADVLKRLLEWRALLKTHAPLLFVLLPMGVWVGLRCWFDAHEVRALIRKARQFCSGKSHPCLLRMVLRWPVKERTPEEGDTCPICLDNLDAGELRFCRWGCGRPVHSACMAAWSSHRNAVGLTECLVCRAWM